MLRLIQLEARKYSFSRIIRNAVIADLIIMTLFIGITFSESKLTGEEAVFLHYSDVVYQTEALIRAVFMIFEAVLIAKLILSEYSDKTIDVMFTYPVSRQKLILAKISIIVLFSFGALILSNLWVNGSFYIANRLLGFFNESLTGAMILNYLKNIFLNSMAYSVVGLIPLYFGIRKKTSAATIVSAIILTIILSSGNETVKLGSLVVVMCGLAVAAAIIVYFYIKNVEKEDLFN